MADEPRLIIRKWFDDAFAECKVIAANLKKRDGVNASFEADYEMSEENLKSLFLTTGLDIIFVIKKVRAEPIKAGRLTIGYRHFLGVQPCVIDKRNADGTVNILAAELLDKALDEVRRIIRENVDAGSAIVMLREEQPASARIAPSMILHGDTAVVRWDEHV